MNESYISVITDKKMDKYLKIDNKYYWIFYKESNKISDLGTSKIL